MQRVDSSIARQRRLPVAAALAVSAACFIAVPAAAQVSTEDRVAAESLFTDARRLMQSGDYAKACPKLEASRRLEAALGTTLNLADCYEKMGRTASAWAEFKGAAAEAQKAGDSVRKTTALERAAALEPKLSRLQINLADPSVSVLRNGDALSAAVLGSAIPVDPGSYRIEAQAPGKLSWTKEVVVRGAGAVVKVDVPALEDDASAAVAEPSATPSEPAPLTDASPPMTVEHGTERTWAWVLGGVGVASVAAGATFGLLASSNWSKAKDGCSDYPFDCDDDAVSQADDASTQATVATVAFVVGAAAIGTSVVLFATSGDEPSAEVAFTPTSVSLRGRF
ncbi:MAG TPA: hypothetical protein VMG12_29460 [Polyangiaceae bacterium]|nr:hypothetical protein [Polyangiaceae bacterium]